MRKLKADKVPKSDVEPAIQALLSLKKEFKEATGKDWDANSKPAEAASSAPAATSPADAGASDGLAIWEKTQAQGETVRIPLTLSRCVNGGMEFSATKNTIAICPVIGLSIKRRISQPDSIRAEDVSKFQVTKSSGSNRVWNYEWKE